MQSFQEAMERGETTHLMPMFNAEEKLKKGIIRKEDIPYMQRGGKWDNTDVKGSKTVLKWSKRDVEYVRASEARRAMPGCGWCGSQEVVPVGGGGRLGGVRGDRRARRF
jgi:hypothetical protein